MADVVVTGGGMNGLSAAMLLAGDGHAVTVLERDASPPPAPGVAWESWDRRSVAQFRMLHLLLPQWRRIAEVELPEVVDDLGAAGALRYNTLDHVPAELVGDRRSEDGDVEILTARRPVVEAVVAAVAERTPGITIRRGVAVSGLATGSSTASGVPHVSGVVTASGSTVRADLVVDATGRRSPLRGWLEAIDARPIIEQEEDLGFVYYGRHFRSDDGSIPVPLGALLQHHDSVSILTLPADNGTWGVGVVASGADADLRRLKDNDVWERVVRSYPLAAHWLDGEPLDDVAMMARIPDRYRRFVVDGAPVATGVLAVGDSWACTNPSLGRGITMGLSHAVALRDLLRTGVLHDPYKLALAWDDTTEATVTPCYRSTLDFDSHRLAEIHAQIEGRPYTPDDPLWEITKAWIHGAPQDGELLRGFLRLISLVEDAPSILAKPGFLDRLTEVGGGWRDAEPLGPTRSQLLQLAR